MKRPQALLVAVIFYVMVPVVSFAADGLYEIDIPTGKKNLYLEIPPELDRSTTTDEAGVVHVEIEPADRSFKLLISVLPPLDRQSSELMDEHLISYLLMVRGKELLETSVEDEISLRIMDRTKGTAVFYCLTDSRETLPEGEFRHMCQGMMVLKKLRYTFTLLLDEPDPQTVDPAIDIVRSSRYR